MTVIGGLADHSGTVTTGGTAQDAVAKNSGRQYLQIQNIDTEVLWVNFGADAAASAPGSLMLNANGGSVTYETGACPTGRVSVVAATTGHKFTIKDA